MMKGSLQADNRRKAAVYRERARLQSRAPAISIPAPGIMQRREEGIQRQGLQIGLARRFMQKMASIFRKAS
jgi:hypothetical protein